MSVVELKVPTIGESITEVTLSKWLKAEGSYVQLDEAICEFESDKATLEFPAEAAGILKYVAAEGDDIEIGAVVATIDTSAAAPSADKKEVAPAAEAPKAAASAPSTTTNHATGHPSPAAGKILSEKGIDPAQVAGSGRDGRITKEDAQNASPAPAAAPKTAATAPAKSEGRTETRQKMSRMRRTIAKRLVSAKNNTAMLTTFNEIDMKPVMDLRKQYQDKFVAKHGIKLGFMSLFAKACAKALLEMPDVNATLDGEELIFHNYADISIAVSTPNGLVVPPVHDCDKLSLADIENRIKDLATKARNNALTLEEMSGGTFTITNGGIFGSMMSTPIINEPQSAILGMHNIVERPMVVNGQIEIRPMMYVALSYDHRVIDGSTSVTFLVRVKELIEDPVSLVMDL